MATLILTNTTVSDVVIDDVGVLVPALSSDTYTDPSIIRDLTVSNDLRTLVLGGVITMSDGVRVLTLDDLIAYWGGAGFIQSDGIGIEQISTLNGTPATGPFTNVGGEFIFNSFLASVPMFPALADSPAWSPQGSPTS